jgi:hypothetical protein
VQYVALEFKAPICEFGASENNGISQEVYHGGTDVEQVVQYYEWSFLDRDVALLLSE